MKLIKVKDRWIDFWNWDIFTNVIENYFTNIFFMRYYLLVCHYIKEPKTYLSAEL